MKPAEFDDIRPYYDEEVPAAMQRIADSDFFALMSAYVFPDRAVEDVRNMVRGFTTTKEFQLQVMYYANKQIIERSTAGLTVGGMEYLRPDRSYLFVSNHRDIMLDASLLEYALVMAGLDTSEITFGSNLMNPQLAVDIGCSNKMFRVERGMDSPRAFYDNSMHLSKYIRYTVTQEHQSIWIAQRSGRTKDGNDMTAPGIIKMFGMSGSKDKVSSLVDLNIVPISMSYEWEPCDYLKALELYQSRFEKYVKKPGEDLNSIIQGIIQYKGKVSLQVCEPLTKFDLSHLSDCTSIDFNKGVAALMDSRIYPAYQLYPNNFIAHDIRYGQNRYTSRYTPEQKRLFQRHLSNLSKYDVEEPDVLRDIFLSIYSNPVENCLK